MHSLASALRNDKTLVERDLLMGADAIADFLGVTRRQVYRLVYDEIIPSFKLGGTVAARKSSLTKWMEALEGQASDS
ncbi:MULTISPECIES: helix-turn-helix domain-containing protein [Sinorhizobium]|uniref:helix-turn-helix domain-containing protein n=1 Tax=Sinorhizobium TaxID=28105 RepID=UPI000B4A188D|nr:MULTISPECIES: helix-turn-helix domain-containing protein [Sinorhizobium]ASP65437.1 DNA-binding protein [Sinorhizobium meliloti]MBO1964664.1 helix-turn-helix domain-containing protein [Sinorhizobium medicae]MDX0058421.1 helix-turn-helix domain-containing protein [Sinorhizobium meliloti]MQX01584.1 helix-turn-helix domain-containing protein [Sinorhizobium meliloti]MQX48185.1 helix-turn-helix domain-containing protein [Sinorhizobium medicae]